MAESGLTVYGATPNAVELINEMGKAIHQSQFFKTDNDSQGKVVAMTCLAKGMDPMSIAQRYHNIKGTLSMRADAMLAEFRTRGGKHRIVNRKPDIACVELTIDGVSEQFEFSWKEAQAEPFVYNGKEAETLRFIEADNTDELKKRLKPKYSTPRARTQMLWARVVSDGVRCVMPEVNFGAYTPEEVEDFEPSRDVLPVDATAPNASPAGVRGQDIEDAEFSPTTTQATTVVGEGTVHRIKELFEACKIPVEKQEAALSQAGASDVSLLTADQAEGLIQALEAKFERMTADMAGSSTADNSAVSEPVDAPIREQTIGQLRELMTQLVQMPGMSDFADRCNAKLQESGMTKLSELTEVDGQHMIKLFGQKNIDAFFELDLKVAAGNAP